MLFTTMCNFQVALKKIPCGSQLEIFALRCPYSLNLGWIRVGVINKTLICTDTGKRTIRYSILTGEENKGLGVL
jgi:hypothetical protein